MLDELQVELLQYKDFTTKTCKVTDEKCLYLLLIGKGKYWRLDYRMDGKRRTLALGVYPEVTLADARKARDEARELIKQGFDPLKLKKVTKLYKLKSIKEATQEVIRTKKKDTKPKSKTKKARCINKS